MHELRSLKFMPPPIVQLVIRCVCTLISGDDIGDAEALELAEMKRRPSSARGFRDEGVVRAAHTVEGRIAAAREKLAATRSGKELAVRKSDTKRVKSTALLPWKEALQCMARPDFKWRLMNLNGKALPLAKF